MTDKKIKKITLYFTFFIVNFVFCVSVNAASFEFDNASESVKAGDVVRILIFIDSKDESERVSIVNARFIFPRELLWAKSFILASGWVPVAGEEYHILDNGTGMVYEAAGIESEAATRVLFGTLEFIAVGEGIAEIEIGKGSFIFNRENKNILEEYDPFAGISIGKKNTIVNITASPLGEVFPLALFDIHVKLSEDTLSSGDTLISSVMFENFGQAPTPVDMFFLITDETGKIYDSSKGSAVVETESVFIKKFEDLNLPPGNYTFNVNTRYNVNIEDDFRIPFIVRSDVYLWWIVSGVSFLLLVFILAFFSRSRKKHLQDTR